MTMYYFMTVMVCDDSGNDVDEDDDDNDLNLLPLNVRDLLFETCYWDHT